MRAITYIRLIIIIIIYVLRLVVGAPAYQENRGGVFKCGIDSQACMEVMYNTGGGMSS